MSIIFGGNFGAQETALDGFWRGLTDKFSSIVDKIGDAFSQWSVGAHNVGVSQRLPKEWSYVDSGFQNIPGTSFPESKISNVDDIKTRRITTQEPQLTVYIKKRAFSSLRSINDTRFMDSGDKFYLRATKQLFENKCAQIAAYESLTKIGKLLADDTDLDAAKIEALMGHWGAFSENYFKGLDEDLFTVWNQPSQDLIDNYYVIKADATKIDKQIEALRSVYKDVKKLRPATVTNWVVDPENREDFYNTGRGCGVIELTLINQLSTHLSLTSGDEGRVSFNFQDPYKTSLITNDDVEIALSAAYVQQSKLPQNIGDMDKMFGISKFGGPQALLNSARELETQLKTIRENRIADGLRTSFGKTIPKDVIMNSALSEFVFEINPQASAGYKVTASVSGVSESFNKNTYAIVMAQLPAWQQLTEKENMLVLRIFNLLEEYVTEIESMQKHVKNINSSSDVKYARRMMRLHYLGKSIVQPMDEVHVYIRGNTRRDSDIIGPISALINKMEFITSFATDQNVTDDVLKMEMEQLGLDKIEVDLDTYKLIRSGSFLQNAGNHVFGGLIRSVTDRYDAGSGQYTVDVSGNSNMRWLHISKVNWTPSLDQREGLLEDPLTYYDYDIDESTGFVLSVKKTPLITNIERMATQSSSNKYITKYTEGIRKGEQVKPETLEQDIVVYGDTTIPVIQHAPGLVCRWKQGIISASLNVNTRQALDGSGIRSNELARIVGQTVSANPFSGMDAADVVSLLVTGFPHNYESFMRHSRSVGNFVRRDGSNSDQSYFRSFFDITRTTNQAFGDFHPLKTTYINYAQLKERIKLQTDLVNSSSTLTNLQSELAKLADQAIFLNVSNEQTTQSDDTRMVVRSRAYQLLNNQIETIKDEIEKETDNFFTSLTQAGDKIKVYGNDVSFDFENENFSSDLEASEEKIKKARLKNLCLQMRPQLATKYNKDVNFFIVGDEYDKDLDLQAYLLNLRSGEQPPWNSEYKLPYQICEEVAKIIDFEFYCDCNGHIQFHPPRYNKTPLSLLLKMFMLRDQKGLELFPPFLKSLFKNKETILESKIDALGLEIQENYCLLGITIDDLPDSARSVVFDEAKQAELLIDSLIVPGVEKPAEKDINDAINLVIDIRNKKTNIIGGNTIDKEDEQQRKKIAGEIDTLQNPKNRNINTHRLEKINRISSLVSERQQLLDMLLKVRKDQESFTTSTEQKITGMRALGMQDMWALLQPFGDLIEDDFNDFLGTDSSKRFIIMDDQIIESNFTEDDSELHGTRVDVLGQIDLIGSEPGYLGDIPAIWAGATDFDLWRQYGWRQSVAINKPFLKEAETQCAPYALMLLSRQRKNIVKGTISVPGNEYYQLADVVYVNHRDTLYYLNSIDHNFNYDSGQFTTTLDLKYGHTLGEYIPTPLDVIGKNIIKNSNKQNMFITARKTASRQLGRCLGIISFKGSIASISSLITRDMLSGGLGKTNIDTFIRVSEIASKELVNGQEYPKLEIRGYYSSTDAESTSKLTVESRMSAVIDWFNSPIGGITEAGETISLNDNIPKISANNISSDTSAVDMSKNTLSEEEFAKMKVPREETFNAGLYDSIEIMLLFE